MEGCKKKERKQRSKSEDGPFIPSPEHVEEETGI